MKKITSLILVAGLLLSAFPSYADFTTPDGITLKNKAKDLTGDGKVNTSELTFIKRIVAKWSDIVYDVSDADFNGDNAVNTTDLVIFKRFVAKWTGYDWLASEDVSPLPENIISSLDKLSAVLNIYDASALKTGYITFSNLTPTLTIKFGSAISSDQLLQLSALSAGLNTEALTYLYNKVTATDYAPVPPEVPAALQAEIDTLFNEKGGDLSTVENLNIYVVSGAEKLKSSLSSDELISISDKKAFEHNKALSTKVIASLSYPEIFAFSELQDNQFLFVVSVIIRSKTTIIVPPISTEDLAENALEKLSLATLSEAQLEALLNKEPANSILSSIISADEAAALLTLLEDEYFFFVGGLYPLNGFSLYIPTGTDTKITSIFNKLSAALTSDEALSLSIKENLDIDNNLKTKVAVALTADELTSLINFSNDVYSYVVGAIYSGSALNEVIVKNNYSDDEITAIAIKIKAALSETQIAALKADPELIWNEAEYVPALATLTDNESQLLVSLFLSADETLFALFADKL